MRSWQPYSPFVAVYIIVSSIDTILYLVVMVTLLNRFIAFVIFAV